MDSSGACTNGIVDCKLNKLRQALNSFPCIGSSTKSDLNKILASAIRAFDVRNYPVAIKRLEAFNSAVDSGDFTDCEKKESDELKARGLSAIFMLRKLL